MTSNIICLSTSYASVVCEIIGLCGQTQSARRLGLNQLISHGIVKDQIIINLLNSKTMNHGLSSEDGKRVKYGLKQQPFNRPVA